MLHRLRVRRERRTDDSIYPPSWRTGYLHAVDDAVASIDRTLAAERFDGTLERRLEQRLMRIELGG
jgi:hypothetical protein